MATKADLEVAFRSGSRATRLSQHLPAYLYTYLPISRSSKVMSSGFGRGLGFLAVGGAGSFCSVPIVDMWRDFGSSVAVQTLGEETTHRF